MFRLKSGEEVNINEKPENFIKKEINGDETKARIIKSLILLNKPSRLAEISKHTTMDRSRIHPHLQKMIESGTLLIYENNKNKYYYPQDIFLQKDILYGLYERLLPFINEINESIDDRQMSADRAECMLENMLIALKLFSFEMEELRNDMKHE